MTEPSKRLSMSAKEMEMLKDIIASSPVAEDGKRYMLNLLWTTDELPEITNQAQCDEYLKTLADVEARIREHGITPGMSEFARSPDGILATALLTRVGEWENRFASMDPWGVK